ncbi:MAG: glycosyltransferase [Candidatus Rokubacteria bacterium]|nr:glycosyltransferase [Candidatus Rokubacteria bacterium]
MRWLLVMGFDRAADFGLDFRDELTAMGHEVRTFAYRRNNVLYKNKGTKAPYQRLILRRLERQCLEFRPAIVLVLKGGPIDGALIQRVKRKIDTLFLNVFPDNPLWMIPFEHIEPYDLFFTKERYALRQLQLAGLGNLYYLPLYCVPAYHHPVDLTGEERRRLDGIVALVGRAYPWRERFVRELAHYPLRLWGPGWQRVRDPRVRALVAGRAVWSADKLTIYSGARLSLNPHHPMNDIVGVNIRTFELAAAGACQVVDLKDDLSTLFKPGEEVVAYRDLAELRRQLDHYLARPDEARAIGENARRRALAEHTLRHRLDEILLAVEERFGKRR